LAFVLALAGCAGANKITLRPVTAKEVPIHFAYGSLEDAKATYYGGESSWSGTSVQRARYRAGDEFAFFELRRAVGDRYFVRRSVAAYVQTLLKEGTKVEWGTSGELRGSAHPTAYETFLLPEAKAACVGLWRDVADHPQAPSADYAQVLLVGYYCRVGTMPIPADEARAIAGAVHA
jgi:hypothetical protein